MDRKIIILILVVASTIAQNIPAGTLAKTPKHRLFLCFLDRQELGSGANSAKRPVEFRGNQHFGQQFIAHKARTDQIISLGITFQEESHDEKFFEIQKLGPHIVAQNHQKIGPIIMVSIHIKPLVKHPEPKFWASQKFWARTTRIPLQETKWPGTGWKQDMFDNFTARFEKILSGFLCKRPK